MMARSTSVESVLERIVREEQDMGFTVANTDHFSATPRTSDITPEMLPDHLDVDLSHLP